MKEIDKLAMGESYCFLDKEVILLKEKAVEQCCIFNQLNPREKAKKECILQKLLGSIGENSSIQSLFMCDVGKNIYIGKNFIANYNVTILDMAEVSIGDNCMIGPNTLLTTVGHPIDPTEREKRMAVAKTIKIGTNVWIGGNCTILPGVIIGDNSIVAAGAVVTNHVPSNTIVAGVPARIIKKIETDS